MSFSQRFCCLNFSTVLLFLLFFPFSCLHAQNQFKAIDSVLQAQQSNMHYNVSMILWKDGHIIYQKNLGSFNNKTLVLIASASKWLTAATVMTFVDEGKLSLDDPVAKYIPAFNQGEKKYITLRECLAHTTGYFESLRFDLIHARTKTLADCVNQIATNLPLNKPPGKYFSYNGIGLQIAARVIEVISHKSFEQNFEERIARPCDMPQTVFVNPVNPLAAAGAKSCAEEYIHFLEMIADNGIYNGKRILSAKSIFEMQQEQTTGTQLHYSPVEKVLNQNWPYGLGEWVEQTNNKGETTSVSSPGKFGTYPFYDKCRNLAGIIVIDSRDFTKAMKADYAVRQIVNKVIPAQNCNE